jgi:hypothetical protein
VSAAQAEALQYAAEDLRAGSIIERVRELVDHRFDAREIRG